MMDSLILSRKIYFSCAHRYHKDSWSDEKNREVFGVCNNPHGHGHNYELEVGIKGPVDPDTGMVMNLTDLDRLLKEQIMAPLDHRFLNFEVDFFKTEIPTTENIVIFCWNQIEAHLKGPARLHHLRLYETPDLFVDYYGQVSDS